MQRRVKRHAVVQPRDQSYRLIPLTQNQNAIVDYADYARLLEWNWSARWNRFTKSFYATTCHKRQTLLMHRVILDCRPGEIGDHKNHDTLDNRRENLRTCTIAENHYNSKKRAGLYKGVYWYEPRNKWMAAISVSGKQKYLGYFRDPKEAARAYDKAASANFGEFAHLNFQPIN